MREVGAVFAAVLSGVLFARAIRARAFWRARLAMHWASFGFVFAVWLPHLVSPVWHVEEGVPLYRMALAAGLLGTAAWLAWHGTQDLCAHGGTPDPLDPPPCLATQGIYARMRNPIQLAEVLLVAVHRAITGASMHVVYTLSFASLLWLPMRRYEERRLAECYGEMYATYKRRVPAFGWAPRARTTAKPRSVSNA